MTAVLTTRFVPSAGVATGAETSHCLLVRIYPVQGIEKPLELATEPLLIGRDERCSLQCDDDSVSRRHAMIEHVGGSHVIVDLGSTNGTFVNEKRLDSSQPLATGDRLRFGNHIYKYLTSDRIEIQYHEVVFTMMTTDGLTSVHNKRYFLDTLEREVAQSCRAGTPLCVMMMDLDKFKSVNDTYGHMAGDTVLVEFARRAKSVMRSGELLARYGGEEFVMLLTRTALDEAVVVAERVREIVGASPVRYESTDIPVTLSLGVSCYHGQSLVDAADLLEHADGLLYEAKHSGRNQVKASFWNSDS